MKRRLAAILSADVVGYSTLMGEDEVGTLETLRGLRETLVDPLAVRWRGRTFKLMGDGALMEFASSVDAAGFAVAVQTAMAERRPATPSGAPVRFRIGINAGEVIDEGGDLFGDCVNLAARLETVAEPGGICVSEAVRAAAARSTDLTFEEIGTVELKNIAEPVAAWRVILDDNARRLAGTAPASGGTARRRSWRVPVAAALAVALPVAAWLSGAFETAPPDPAAVAAAGDRPSIAVLPFDNPGGEQAYFADGIAEDLITDLARIPGLFVIARNSTFALKGQFTDVREIAALLDARFIVEGSVRRAGDTIRITVQLTDAPAGQSIWAERYDRPLDDVFAVQDEVRERIAAALAVKVDPTLATRMARRDRISVEAYDLLLQGIAAEGAFTREALAEARRLFLRVTEVEPDFAEAYARLANTYDVAATLGWAENRGAALALALDNAGRALRLNPVLPYAHWTHGRILTRLERPDDARAALGKAIDLSPNYADAHAFLALLETYYGNAEAGLRRIDTAVELNPLPPFWYWYARGTALYLLGRAEEAVPDLVRSVEGNPNVSWARQILVAAYADLNRIEDAEWEIDELSVSGYSLAIADILERSSLKDPAYLSRLEQSLRAAGIE